MTGRAEGAATARVFSAVVVELVEDFVGQTCNLAADTRFFGALFKPSVDCTQSGSFDFGEGDLAVVVEVVRLEVFLGRFGIGFAHTIS